MFFVEILIFSSDYLGVTSRSAGTFDSQGRLLQALQMEVPLYLRTFVRGQDDTPYGDREIKVLFPLRRYVPLNPAMRLTEFGKAIVSVRGASQGQATLPVL